MSAPPASARPRLPSFRDLLALSKPHITLFAALMAGWGMLLAPGGVQGPRAWLTILGVGLLVAAAGCLNMVIERRGDALMARTQDRPLPAGRVRPSVAAALGVVMAAAALALLWRASPLSALIGLGALLCYLGLYTPLKRLTPLALIPGAVAGAAPPIIGWAAATGEVGGVSLAAVLAMWQIPHFLAIALFRGEEYQRAGIKALVVVVGPRWTKVTLVVMTLVLVTTSLGVGVAWELPEAPLGALAAAGLGLTAAALWGLRPTVRAAWARGFYRLTLVYLPVVALAFSVAEVRW